MELGFPPRRPWPSVPSRLNGYRQGRLSEAAPGFGNPPETVKTELPRWDHDLIARAAAEDEGWGAQ
jgi:hypothetical protein